MIIEKIDRKSGFVTLEISDEELRTVTNIFCRARKQQDFSKKEYAVNAELFTAITVLHHGRIPNFEINLIKDMQEKAQRQTTVTNTTTYIKKI